MPQYILAQISTKKFEILRWVIISLSSANHAVNSCLLIWRQKAKCALCHLLTMRAWPPMHVAPAVLSAHLTSLPGFSLLWRRGIPPAKWGQWSKKPRDMALPCPRTALLPQPIGNPCCFCKYGLIMKTSLKKHKPAACNSSVRKVSTTPGFNCFSSTSFEGHTSRNYFML